MWDVTQGGCGTPTATAGRYFIEHHRALKSARAGYVLTAARETDRGFPNALIRKGNREQLASYGGGSMANWLTLLAAKKSGRLKKRQY